MIEVYDVGNEAFTRHGNVILTPTECRVKMVAGGSYELSMGHPMDPEGKWKHLVPGAIVKVPVPEERIENAYAGYAVDIYRVTATEAQVRESPSAPSAISYTTWTNGSSYAIGGKVSWLGKNYQCDYWDPTSGQIHTPPDVSAWWHEIPARTNGAAVLVSVAQGGELYFVEDVDTTWYKLSTYYGIVGYVLKSQVAFDRHLDPSEVKPRIIEDQLMRIVSATADTKNRAVSVSAQHVSYDLNGIIVQELALAQASPAMAIGRIVEALMIPWRGTVATNLDAATHGTYTETIRGKTGTYCLLDPDKGVAGQFGAEVRRDNWDIFIMEKTETDRGFRIRYRKNALGISWSRKSDSLVTRVVPVAKDEKGEALYLPEKWVDSAYISSYPVIRMEQLPVAGQVGKDDGSGTGTTWTLNNLYDEMRAKAGERFSVDRADRLVEDVTVDFEMLGDTAEHPELRGLEKVLLYDRVGAINEEIGLDVTLTVTEMEWDAIRKKVVSIKLSTENEKAGRNVTGYNIQNKSVGVNKLSDDVASGILEQVRDIIPEYADPNAARPSTFSVIDNLTSTSAADALSANQGRVLNGLKARKIVMNNTVDTWEKVWAIIDTLEIRETATLYAVSGAYALLSGGATSEMMVGTITRVGQTDQFEIIAKTTNNRLICARITGASSSSAGTYEEINYSSRQMGSNDNPITSLANIPLNSSGNMILAAAISPTGSLGSYAYWKHGNDDTRWSIMAVYETNNRAYINSYANGAYSGWRELVTDRISTFRAVSSSRNVTFTIPTGSNAIALIGSSGTAMYMSSNNTLTAGAMPSGFSVSNSGTSVTITRDTDTAYVCSVIIVPA